MLDVPNDDAEEHERKGERVRAFVVSLAARDLWSTVQPVLKSHVVV